MKLTAAEMNKFRFYAVINQFLRRIKKKEKHNFFFQQNLFKIESKTQTFIDIHVHTI